jgi:hypothetical protein
MEERPHRKRIEFATKDGTNDVAIAKESFQPLVVSQVFFAKRVATTVVVSGSDAIRSVVAGIEDAGPFPYKKWLVGVVEHHPTHRDRPAMMPTKDASSANDGSSAELPIEKAVSKVSSSSSSSYLSFSFQSIYGVKFIVAIDRV